MKHDYRHKNFKIYYNQGLQRPRLLDVLTLIIQNTMKNTEMAVALAAATCTNVQQMMVAETVFDQLPTTQLSRHFSLREFVISATAIRFGIDNTPPDEAVARLKVLCEKVLEPLRLRFGMLRITSGYRSPIVNEKVGGVATSQHTMGEAADIHVPNDEVGMKMYNYIRCNLDFDQLIYEYRSKTGARWMHVSYRADGNNRHEAWINASNASRRDRQRQ